LTLVDSHPLVAVAKLLSVTYYDAVAVVNWNCPVVRHANPLISHTAVAVAGAVVLVVSRFCRAFAAHESSQTYNGGKQ